MAVGRSRLPWGDQGSGCRRFLKGSVLTIEGVMKGSVLTIVNVKHREGLRDYQVSQSIVAYTDRQWTGGCQGPGPWTDASGFIAFPGRIG